MNKNRRIILASITIIIVAMIVTLGFSAFADGQNEYTQADVENYSESSQGDSSGIEQGEKVEPQEESSDMKSDSPKISEGKSGKTDGVSTRMAEPVILISEREVLILGLNNKYIVKPLNGSSYTPNPPAIHEVDWSDDPADWTVLPAYQKVLRAGKYDENSIIEFRNTSGSYNTGSSIYTVPGHSATISQIKSRSDTPFSVYLFILTGTDLNIKNTNMRPAIDFSAAAGAPSTVSAYNDLYLHVDSKLTIEVAEQIIDANGGLTVNSGSVFDAKTTQVSTKPSMDLRGVLVNNGTFTLDSKSTTYGIYHERSFRTFGASTVSITVPSGIASSVGDEFVQSDSGTINIHNQGDGKGIEIRGLPGIGSTFRNNKADGIVNVKVEGIGIGIEVNGGDFYAGGINTDIFVNEGIGIYASRYINTVSQDTLANTLNVKVNKGVAAVAGKLMIDNNFETVDTTLNFESLGESDNTAIIPGVTIPKSAGLVLFSGDSSSDKAFNFTAKAPKDIVGSYGVYMSPSASTTGAYGPPNLNIGAGKTDISGHIGIEGTSVYFGGSLKIDATKHAIVAQELRLTNAVIDGGELFGEESALKLRNQDPTTINTSEYDPDSIQLKITNTEVKFKGGKYGIEGENNVPYGGSRNAFDFNKSKVTVESTEPDTTALHIIDNDSGKTIKGNILDTDITVIGMKNGAVLENLGNFVFRADTAEHAFVSTADEIAISIDGTTKLMNNYKIHGISRKILPDEAGKIPAVFFGNAPGSLEMTAGSPKLIEEYLTKASKPVVALTPFMLYASDRNVAIDEGVWNDSANWSYPDTRYNITTLPAGLTTNDSTANALVVGNMKGTAANAKIKFASGSYEIITRADLNSLVITFDPDGGTPTPPTQTVFVGDKITDPGTVEKTGHTLLHWKDEGDVVWDFADNTIQAIGNKTMTAVWAKIKLDLTYNGNVGTTGDLVTGLEAASKVEYGDTITKPTDPTRYGYDFVEWTKDVAGTTPWDFATDTVTVNTVLYAKWSIKSYTVTFDMDGGTPAILPETVVYREKATEPAVPTKTGYLFIEWTKDAAGATPWKFTTDTVKGDTKLYAQWEKLKYVLTYSSVGGVPEQQLGNFDFDELITLPKVEPTKRLHKFVGWYKDAAHTQPVNFGVDRMPDDKMTIYGKWERTHYEIFFNVNGGDKVTEPKTMAIEIGKPADISQFQPGQGKAPKYKANFFLGWTDQANNKVIANFNMPNNDVTLKANWISAESIFDFRGENSIVGYKDKITEKEIDGKLKTTAEFTDYLGKTTKVEVKKEWDSTIISRGGVEKIKLYILDSSGNKIYINEEIHAYILNEAYIGARDFVSFELHQRPTVDGSEWGAIAYKELPDFSGKTINRVRIKTVYNENDFTTDYGGMYNPYFTADDLDHFGNKITLVKSVTAFVSYISAAEGLGEEIAKTSDNTNFWIEVSETLHLSQRKESWHLDGKSYKAGPSKLDNLKDTKLFDRKVIADPMSYLNMSAEALQVLKQQDNSRLEVKMNILTWYFDSKDFKDVKTEPTGFYPLDVDNYTTNKTLVQAGKNGNSMQLHFEMNKYWQGKATLEVDLTKALLDSGKKGNSIYMFHYNENTKELELIGKMLPAGTSRYSIKLNGVFKDYIIMDHLPGSVAKSGSGVTKKINGSLTAGKQIDTPISYRITDLTNPLDENVKMEINHNLESSGKTIDQITLAQPQKLEQQSNFKTPILIIVLVLLVSAAGFLIFLFVKRKRDEEEYYYE